MNDEKKSNKKRKDSRVECEYFEDIEITDPLTGKKNTQRVKITRYKTVGSTKDLTAKAVAEEIEEDQFNFSWENLENNEGDETLGD